MTSTGTSSDTTIVLPKITNGARWKIHDACRDTTMSLRNSLRSSAYGCQIGAPRRFCMRAFSHRMKPTSAGASASDSSACPISTAMPARSNIVIS